MDSEKVVTKSYIRGLSSTNTQDKMVTHVIKIIMVIRASRDTIMLCTNITTSHAVINALTTVGVKAMNTASLMGT